MAHRNVWEDSQVGIGKKPVWNLGKKHGCNWKTWKKKVVKKLYESFDWSKK